jgi:hypothetical protein
VRLQETERSEGILPSRTAATPGGPSGNRTHNPRIKSPLLCQLSYRPSVLRPDSLPTEPASVHTGAVDWIGIGVILALGTAAVAYGYLWDRTSDRRRQRAMESAPERDIPGLSPDAAPPTYVSAKDLPQSPKAMDAAELADIQSRIATSTPIPHGHGTGAFATDTASGLAVLPHPLILVTDGELSSMRELLPVVEQATKGRRPLVVIAAAIDDELYQTLVANSVAGTLSCVAVDAPDAAERANFSEASHATELSLSDLRMGWAPATSLGSCETWVSSPTQSWLLNTSPS